MSILLLARVAQEHLILHDLNLKSRLFHQIVVLQRMRNENDIGGLRD